ncbi:MAG: calcium/sodium antiporter [candidate division Zixibacteria bacterium]|nr:calcium/sodium antiporter [candidate division Zixibacteria bacterium]
MYVIEILCGLALLVLGGHWLINSTGRLAIALRVPTLVISLVLIAYGTSSPEIAVSLSAALRGANEIVIGNVVGSNIINIALILGLGAIITPLKAHIQLLKREAPLMLLVTLLMVVALFDRELSRIEGIIALAAGLGYTVFLIVSALKERKTKYADPEQVVGRSTGRWRKHALLAAVSLAAMIYGADMFVKGAIVLSERIGASPLVIGLTVVAIGTSLPELVTTVFAAVKKQEDIAISNVIGSNIFNVLIVLGLTAVIAPVKLGDGADSLWIDLGVMVIVTIAFVALIRFGQNRITRVSGIVFVSGYIIYMCYLLL